MTTALHITDYDVSIVTYCNSCGRQVPLCHSVAAPSIGEMDDVEAVVLNMLRDEEFTSKFFKFLALGTREKESFSSRHYTFFKVGKI